MDNTILSNKDAIPRMRTTSYSKKIVAKHWNIYFPLLDFILSVSKMKVFGLYDF